MRKSIMGGAKKEDSEEGGEEIIKHPDQKRD